MISAARTPWILFAATHAPTPLPQMATPRLFFPLATDRASGTTKSGKSYAMPNGSYCLVLTAVFNPIHQNTYCRLMVRRFFYTRKGVCGVHPFNRKDASCCPILLIDPFRTFSSLFPESNSANLMLDEPPLIVRMCEAVDFMVDSLAFLQFSGTAKAPAKSSAIRQPAGVNSGSSVPQ